MIKINVLIAFVLTMADGAQKKFNAGLHEVEEEIASHWYVQAHSEPVASDDAEDVDAKAKSDGSKKAKK